MKRSAVLCTIILATVIQLYSQNDTPKEMTGWICTSACVSKNTSHASCDSSCATKDKSGEAVFVDDNGKISKISNPEIVKGKMGKKVKGKGKMNKDNDSMWLFSIYG